MKVYTRPDDPGHSRPSPQGCYVKPAILTTIDDESLPHPGDGREWKDEGLHVDILTLPVHEPSSGVLWVMVRDPNGQVWMRQAEDLRERPKTRTVTLELTEDEAGLIGSVDAERVHGTLGSLYARLAKALEDTP